MVVGWGFLTSTRRGAALRDPGGHRSPGLRAGGHGAAAASAADCSVASGRIGGRVLRRVGALELGSRGGREEVGGRGKLGQGGGVEWEDENDHKLVEAGHVTEFGNVSALHTRNGVALEKDNRGWSWGEFLKMVVGVQSEARGKQPFWGTDSDF